MSSNVLIEFVGIHKTYDNRRMVIEDLNLNVRRGEFLTLLGASGSGKTTTLMMLAGFEEASSGEIRKDGVPIQYVPPHRRGMGMVFQDYALFPHMTTAQNLAYPLRMRGMSRSAIKDEVARAISLVRLEGMEERKPEMLSGGQQQRVALARALIFRPDLVLLDEPLGALDKNLRERMQLEIKALHRELGVTVVYVTHDQSEALTMSDRIAIFRNGYIVQLSSPGEIYERPCNSYVAGFVGENNLVSGRITAREGELVTVRLVSGYEVRAQSSRPIGQAVQLAVRPERLRVCSEGKELPNCMRVVAQEVIYLGDHVRIIFDIGAHCSLMAKMKLPSSSYPSAGDQLQIGWDIQDGWVFPDDAPQGVGDRSGTVSD